MHVKLWQIICVHYSNNSLYVYILLNPISDSKWGSGSFPKPDLYHHIVEDFLTNWYVNMQENFTQLVSLLGSVNTAAYKILMMIISPEPDLLSAIYTPSPEEVGN